MHQPDHDGGAGQKITVTKGDTFFMSNATSVSAERKSETEILHFLLQHALESELPIAFWRLPNSPIRYLIISQEHRALQPDAAIEELPTGFMFAPFDREKNRLFLPGDFIFSFEDSVLRAPDNPAEIASQAWLTERLKLRAAGSEATQPASVHEVTSSIQAAAYDDFTELVKKGVAEIERGAFEKVVLSRTRIVDLPENFDIVRTFENLCSRYAHALVSFVSIPGVGSWLGATPEALVSVEDKSIFRTVALAGTLPYIPGTNLRTVAWTQKEIEEHALVERYVISCFKKIRVREYDEHGPKTVVAGNLVHLKSDFTVDMKDINFPQLGSVMLQLLHPTAAVCGMPLDSSLEFIKQHEGYDREFYSGYLGPVNVNKNIDLFVNLRCMKLLDNQAKLFAGAGVTFDSLPEKEFEETEMKFKTLLNVIG
jgi:isochorismate synthase